MGPYVEDKEKAKKWFSQNQSFYPNLLKARYMTSHSIKWSYLYDCLYSAGVDTDLATGLTYLIEDNEIEWRK